MSSVPSESTSDTEKRIAFEKVRFEYCSKVYEEETARKETLEKKAQFYFSFITLLLGVIFLNLDFLLDLRDLIIQSSSPILFFPICYGALGTALILLVIALLAIFRSVHLQKYTSGYPRNMIHTLFAPQSDFLEKEDEPTFLRATAMNYAIALEFNGNLNIEKAKWVKISSYSLSLAVIILTVFLAAVIYLSAQ